MENVVASHLKQGIGEMGCHDVHVLRRCLCWLMADKFCRHVHHDNGATSPRGCYFGKRLTVHESPDDTF